MAAAPPARSCFRLMGGVYVPEALAAEMDDQQQRTRGVLLVDASGSGGGRIETESAGGAEPDAGGDHRRLAGVDGGDDFGAVDSLQVNGRDAEVGVT
jgi:hypothetical protein